jgi:hypothetical protein
MLKTAVSRANRVCSGSVRVANAVLCVAKLRSVVGNWIQGGKRIRMVAKNRMRLNSLLFGCVFGESPDEEAYDAYDEG